MTDIENISRGWKKRALDPVARTKASDGEVCARGRGGAGGRLARWRETGEVEDGREKWLPPGAGRRNIKGNRLLVREVKNRPSPGHTRIAFIHLLYVLYHRSVIPFRRAAPRGDRDARGITHIPLSRQPGGWHGLCFRSPSSPMPVRLYFLYLRFRRLISPYDGILCIIYATYRRQKATPP